MNPELKALYRLLSENEATQQAATERLTQAISVMEKARDELGAAIKAVTATRTAIDRRLPQGVITDRYGRMRSVAIIRNNGTTVVTRDYGGTHEIQWRRSKVTGVLRRYPRQTSPHASSESLTIKSAPTVEGDTGATAGEPS